MLREWGHVVIRCRRHFCSPGPAHGVWVVVPRLPQTNWEPGICCHVRDVVFLS